MVRFNIDCALPFSPDDFWRIRDAPSFIRFIVADGMLKKMTVTTPEPDADGWMTRKQHYCPARVDCPDIVRAVVGDTMFDVVDEQRWNHDVRPCHLHFTIKPSFLAALSSTHGELSLEPHPRDDDEDDDDDVDTASSSGDELRPSREDSADPDAVPGSEPPRAGPLSDGSADAGSERDDADTGSSLSDAGAGDADADAAGDAPEEDPALAIAALPARDKSRHVVKGVTRVRILTVGWFVERAIVHNLKKFYAEYPASVLRFRHWLYDRFAAGDRSVPAALVVDRFLEAEARLIEAERLEKETADADERSETDADAADVAQRDAACADARACESGEFSSVTTGTAGDSARSDSSDGLSSD